MASALLPSLRYIRATLVAGLLWLVAGRIWFEPGVAADKHPGITAVWRGMQDIAHVAAPTSTVVSLLFAAYLLGVVSEAALGALTRWLMKWIVIAHRYLAGASATPGGTVGSTNTLDGYLNGAFARSMTWFNAQGSDPRERVRRLLLRARDDAPHVAADIDRLRAEAEFRLQLIPPVIGLAVAFGHQAGWFVALVGAPCVVTLAASANHCAELANDELADWAQAVVPAPEA
jgi:hypothetical protein